MRYSFSDCLFDNETFELRRNGERVDTTPMVLSILRFFLVSRSRLVTKNELIDEVWGGRAISDAAITVRIRALRQAIGDTGADQRLLKTVRGRGFRFVGEVKAKPNATQRPSDDHPIVANAQEERAPVDIDPRPTVAVLPFLFQGEGDQHTILQYAIPDELLTELSKMGSIFVIARGSSFQFQSHRSRPKEVRDKLAARYCVSGTVEISGSGLIISAELSETLSENVIWRERKSIDLQEIHEFRSELVRSIAKHLGDRIKQHELTIAMLTPARSLDSWQSFHLGMHHLNVSPVEHFREAETFFGQSLDIDSGFARARAGLSQIQFFRLHWGNSQNPGELVGTCVQSAERALNEDPYDPFCNLAMGRTYVLTRDYGAWREHVERATQLSPSYSLAFADLARIQAVAGELAESESTLEIVERLDPQGAHPESMDLTRMIIDLKMQNMDVFTRRAVKMSADANLGLNTSCCVLIALHIGGMQEETQRMAAKMKRQFLAPRLREWFETDVFQNPEIFRISKEVGKIYDFT